MAKALYRKWRPQNWDEVTAQEHVIQTLRNAIINDRVAHAYLFAGPRGTGKTTTARLLAKAVNCLEPDLAKRPCNTCEHCQTLNAGRFMDLIEIDAASNTSVDDVRDLREKINFSPSQGKFKVYIIDEVHMLSTAAFNALLKTLEEPPPHAIFILATTEIHKIPATVLSRCQWHEFRRIPIKDIIQHLKENCQREGIQVDEGVFAVIARQATGSLRDAISLLDQLTSTTETITLEMAQKVMGTATNDSVLAIIDMLIARDPAQGLTQINKSLDSGTDPRQLARQLVTYLRNVLLFKMGNDDQIEAADTVRQKMYDHAQQISMIELLKAIEAFNQATTEKHANWHPGLGLELAFTTYLIEPHAEISDNSKPLPTTEESQPVKVETRSKPRKSPQKPAIEMPQSDSDEGNQNESTMKHENPFRNEKKQPSEQPHRDISEDDPIEEIHEAAHLDGDITLSDIHQAWGKIKSLVGNHNRRTEGLLNTTKLVGLKENTLMLGFSSEILKEMMEKEGNIILTTDILEEVLGSAIMVQCISTTHQGSALPEDIKIDKDGMVDTATRDLGGKISSAEETS